MIEEIPQQQAKNVINIHPLHANYAGQVAKIHQLSQEGTFLSRLGLEFLTVLYEQISESDYGISYVAVNDQHVLGFIAGTLSTGKIFKQIVLKRPMRLGWIVLKQAARQPVLLWYALKTVTYPFQHNHKMPSAELLALAIEPAWRNHQLGSRLVVHLQQTMMQTGVDKMLVTVDSNNQGALRFYKWRGFEYLFSSDMYGRTMEHLVCNLTAATDKADGN